MKYFILLLLLFSITHYTNWRDVEIARWERDLKNVMIGKGEYWHNSQDDCRIELANAEAEKCRWINYVFAQEKYYRSEGKK